jgi:hypothetical protein
MSTRLELVPINFREAQVYQNVATLVELETFAE